MEKKYALVTGGSRGIGKAVALTLAKELGYNILLNYSSNTSAAEETKKEIEGSGKKCELLQFDVSISVETQKALENWLFQNPEAVIEVVVNNAGIARDGLFLWMKEDDWQKVVNTSLNGFYNVTKPLLQKMLENRYGRIINVVSVSGQMGTPGQVNYSAAKGAVIAATKALAKEVAKRNVTVNAVAPGFVESDMTKNLDKKTLVKSIPAKRFGTPEEVADLVCFLASEKSAYITGEIININGGIYS